MGRRGKKQAFFFFLPKVKQFAENACRLPADVSVIVVVNDAILALFNSHFHFPALVFLLSLQGGKKKKRH